MTRSNPIAVPSIGRSVLYLAIACLVVVFIRVDARAENAKSEKTWRNVNLVVTPKVFNKLDEIHSLLDAEQYDDAIVLLDKLAGRRRLTDHERAIVLQTYAFAYSNKGDYENAAESFQGCLDNGALHDDVLTTIRYNLGQIFMALEDYDAAVKELTLWEAQVEKPSANAYYLIGSAYTRLGQINEALPYIRKAVDHSTGFKESWWQLLLALNVQEKRYEDAVEILAVLLEHSPKKIYFQQLQGVYSELGQDQNALAVMELSYHQGYLESDIELRRLAQLYLFHGIPGSAARVMEMGLAEGKIDSDREAWELLANSWIYAREYERAIDPLNAAAEHAENGEIYLKLAQLYMEDERWNKARHSIGSAIERGDLADSARAQLMLGITSLKGQRHAEAREAFEVALQSESTGESARRWLTHLDQVEREIAEEARADAEFRSVVE